MRLSSLSLSLCTCVCYTKTHLCAHGSTPEEGEFHEYARACVTQRYHGVLGTVFICRTSIVSSCSKVKDHNWSVKADVIVFHFSFVVHLPTLACIHACTHTHMRISSTATYIIGASSYQFRAIQLWYDALLYCKPMHFLYVAGLCIVNSVTVRSDIVESGCD